MMLGHQTQNATPGFFGRTWNSTREIYLLAWVIAAFAFIVLPIPMWLANAYAWDWLRFTLNGSLTLVGTFLIFFYGLRPTNVLGAGGISGLFAQLMDRDGSQGVAAGPALLYRVVLWIGFSYFMLGVTLTTWSMNESPGMFWLAYLCVIGLTMVSQLMQWKGRWAPLIAGAYLLGCLGFAVWETTLSNNFEAATGETWFDDDTGKAVIVGYYNQGKFVPDPRGRSAAKCAASSTGCFYKGIKLVTPTPDDAPDTSGFGINRIIDGVTKTPAELAAEEAAEQAELDAAHQRRDEIAKANQPAPFDPTLQPIVKTIYACGNKWTEVDIPAKRTIHLPWNTAAATYQWRDVLTGKWVEKPKNGADAVRICAKHENYAGDEMTITFSVAS